MSKTKVCTLCNQELPLEDFYEDPASQDGHKTRCKKCYNPNKKQNNKRYVAKHKVHHNKILNEWKKRNPDKVKNYTLKRAYGITKETYDIMYAKQNGQCAICGKHQSTLKKSLCVDRSHVDGSVRGLLCNKCNWLLGHSEEDINVLRNAVKYLINNGTKGV